MKETYIKLTRNLIFSIILLIAFATPIFFLPTTSEFFEFNKFSLLLVATFTGLILWTARMILEKKASFTRTPLDIPILLLVLVFLVTSMASLDSFISFVGAQGRIWPSFLTISTAAGFYFLVTSNVRNRKQVQYILWALIASTTISSVVAIASYFGVYLPFDFAQTRAFTPLGAPNKLALLQAFVLPASLSLIVISKDKAIQIALTIATIIMALSFVLINSTWAYIPLAAALLFLGLTHLRGKVERQSQQLIAIIAVFAVLFLVMRFIPQVASGTLYAWIADKQPNITESQQIDTPKEIVLPQRAGWDIAAQTIGKRPLKGTGPGTYQFAYTQLKPRYINATDQWSVRFTKSSSEFTELVATTGIFGILAYLLFVVVILRFIWALAFKTKNSFVYLPLSAAVVSYIVSTFFAVSSISTVIPFFLGLALLCAIARTLDENYVYEVTVELATLKNKLSWFPLGSNMGLIKTTTDPKEGYKSQVLPTILFVIAALATFMAAKYQVNAYRGEYFYRQALLAATSNNGNKTIDFLQKAINANPSQDSYHRILGQTALNAALSLNQKGDKLTDEEKTLLTQLAQVAVDQAKVASGYQILPLRLPGISAANVENWETLSAVYQTLIGSISGAEVHATNTLAQAVSLDPENPILHERLGQLYQRLNSLDLAQRKFEDATVVKGDLGTPHYRLAKILIERKGEVPRIVNELTLAKRFLPKDDAAMAEIDKNLDEYNKQLRELQEKAAAEVKKAKATPDPNATPSPSPSGTPSPTPTPTPKASPSPSL